MGLTLNDPFREVIGLGCKDVRMSLQWLLYGRSFLDSNKVNDIGEWPISRCVQLERFYCKN